MRRFLLASVLSLAALLLFAPAPLRADGTSLDTFVFSENNPLYGQLSLSWQLPAQLNITDPTLYTLGQGFVVPNVLVTATFIDPTTSLPTTATLPDSFAFYNSGTSFTINLIPPQFQDALGFALAGVSQLYCGPENTPTFIAGTYSGFDPNYGTAAVLTIATPEPSSILMSLVGFLALAGVLAFRKIQG